MSKEKLINRQEFDNKNYDETISHLHKFLNIMDECDASREDISQIRNTSEKGMLPKFLSR